MFNLDSLAYKFGGGESKRMSSIQLRLPRERNFIFTGIKDSVVNNITGIYWHLVCVCIYSYCLFIKTVLLRGLPSWDTSFVFKSFRKQQSYSQLAVIRVYIGVSRVAF